MRRLPRPFLLGLIALAIGFGLLALRNRPVRPAPAARAIAVTAELRAKPLATVESKKGLEPRAKASPEVATEIAAFDAWLANYLKATPAEREGLESEGIRLATERRAELAKLIREDPRAALAAAVPMVARQQLPENIAEWLEERVSGRGKVALLAGIPSPSAPRREATTTRVALVAGQEYEAHVFGRRDLPVTVNETSLHGIALEGHVALAESPVRILEPGERAAGRPVENAGFAGAGPFNWGEVNAVEFNGVIHLLAPGHGIFELERALIAAEEPPLAGATSGPGSSDVIGRVSKEWTHGPKTVLIMRVDFPDRPGTPKHWTGSVFDETAISQTMATVTEFFRSNSFELTQIVFRPSVQGDSPDVTPVLRMPKTFGSYLAPDGGLLTGTFSQDALAAATAAGIDASNYSRVGFLFSYSSDLWFSGLGEIGGRQTWYNGAFDLRIVAHELGHNYGVHHSNAWIVPDGNPVSPSGYSQEYADEFDVMGSGDDLRDHFGAWQKSLLQWIPDAAVTSPRQSGIHRIYALDPPLPVDLAKPRAIKLSRDAERDYWIGMRVRSPETAFDSGATIVWGYGLLRPGDLLDMTPETVNFFSDSPLPIGRSFTDPVPGVTIRPVAKGGEIGEQWMDIQVTFTPSVGWSERSFAGAETEGRAVLRVRRFRDFAAPLSVNWRTVNGTAVAGSDFVAANGVLNWAAGDASDRFITISLVADNVTEGAENFAVVLESPVGATLAGEPAADVMIGEAGGRDPSWATDYPRGLVNDLVALPNGDTVIVGGFDPRLFSSPPEFPHAGILKLAPDGSPVAGFAEGAGLGLNGDGWRVVRLPDGRFLVGGDFEEVHGVAQRFLARLNADGSLDASFRPVLNGRVRSLLPLPDGRVLVGGQFSTVNGAARRLLVRLHANGVTDAEFVPPAFGGGFESVNCLAGQADGRVLVGGLFTQADASGTRTGLVRLRENGAIDESFASIGAGATQPDSAAHVTALALRGDGRILVGGIFDRFNGVPRGGLVQLRPDGTIDAGFVGTTDGYVEAIQWLGADRIAVGGNFAAVNGQPVQSLALLDGNGGLDTAAAAQGGFVGAVYRFALLPSNRLQFIGEGHFPGPWEFRELWRMFTGVSNGPGVVSLTVATVSGTEGGNVSVTVTRTGGSSGEIVVPYATQIGTAGTNDFVPASGVLRWANGDTAPKTITVALRADDVGDPVESFSINLGNSLAGGALMGAITQTIASIQPGPDVPQPPEESWAVGDVGGVGVAGSSSESGAQVTLRGSGADIWGGADGFHFRSVRMTGDGTIVARVASLSNTHAWAKAGLMFREDRSPGARNVFAYVTAGNHVGLQMRSMPGGSSAVVTDGLATMPQWLRLQRTGNTFVASRSVNGVDWIAVGTTTCELPATVEVGLAVTSHNNALLATAGFEQIEVTAVEPPSTAPAPPSGLHATAVASTSATIAWNDNSNNETGFAIERASGGGASFGQVATVGPNVTSYVDAGLAPGTTYIYRVRAVAGAVFSVYSDSYTLMTTSGPPPAEWTAVDVGNVGLSGSNTEVVGGSLTVQAAGADIWGGADGFRYVYRPWRGDGAVVARITRLDPTDNWAKAGVMFRESLQPGARNVMALLTAGNAAGMQVRATNGGATTFTAGPRLAVPHWVRLVREGNTFFAATSVDGMNWMERGTVALDLPEEILVGLAVASHTVAARTMAVFEQIMVVGEETPPPPPVEWTQTNWGTGGGSFTVEGEGWSVSARGADIWGASDSGMFVHRTSDGDGAITMRIDSLTNTHTWAKAGIMYRAGSGANAANVFLAVTPGAGLTFQVRASTGGGTVEVRRVWGVAAPVWLRLRRAGNEFTAEYSHNGSAWLLVTQQVLALPASAEAGVAVSSHASAATSVEISNLAGP